LPPTAEPPNRKAGIPDKDLLEPDIKVKVHNLDMLGHPGGLVHMAGIAKGHDHSRPIVTAIFIGLR
jgi:hypothetical protein